MFKKIMLYVLLPVIVFGMFFTSVQAEDEMAAPDPDQNIADSWMMYPMPGKTAEFEAALKEHVAFRESKNDPREWQMYTPYVGDNLGHYIIRSCCFKWSDLDAYGVWGDESGANEHYAATVGKYVKHTEHYFAKIDFENSNWKNDPDYRYFSVTNIDVKNGAGEAYSDAKKQISTLAKEGGWPRNWSWSSTIGGEGGVSLVSPMKSMAEMKSDQPFSEFLAEHLKSEKKAKAVLKNYSDQIEDSSYSIYVIRPDLMQ